MDLKKTLEEAKDAGFKFASYVRERAGNIYEGVLMAKDTAKFLNHGRDGAILTYSFCGDAETEEYHEHVDNLSESEVLELFQGHEAELVKIIDEVLKTGSTEGLRI